jgi:type IV secretory pathway VirB3-like protein
VCVCVWSILFGVVTRLKSTWSVSVAPASLYYVCVCVCVYVGVCVCVFHIIQWSHTLKIHVERFGRTYYFRAESEHEMQVRKRDGGGRAREREKVSE